MKLSQRIGDAPLWSQLHDIIYNKIISGEFAVNEILPSEPQFVDEYGVSRITVRQAMDKLVAEGLISKKRGKGTIVLERNNDLSTMLSVSFQTVDEVNNDRDRIIEFVRWETAPKKVARLFELQEGASVLHVRRYCKPNNQIIAVFDHYLNPSFVTKLDESFESFYMNIEKNNGIRIDNYTEKAMAGAAQGDELNYLCVPEGAPILIRKRKGYMNNNLIEYTVCKYRSDKYTIIIRTTR